MIDQDAHMQGPGRDGHVALAAWLFLILLILAGGRVEAGTFRIAPTLGDVPPGKSTATFRIVNTGNDVLTVQITAVRWSQQGNADAFDDAEELLVVPPLASIAPGKTQIVRIARQGQPPTAREEAYRVFFHEVPAAPPQGFVGVQTSLRLSVPLFFAPKTSEGRLAWTAGKSASGQLRLGVENRGTRFARLTRVRLQDKKGREVAELGGPQYALAGATRYWNLPGTTHLAPGTELTAIVEMGSTQQEFPLQIE